MMKTKDSRGIIFFYTTIFIISGCATNLTEHEAYEQILKLQKNKYYSRASFETYKFEAAYPDSRHMCDILNVRLNHLRRTDSLEGYREELEKKLKDMKCDL